MEAVTVRGHLLVILAILSASLTPIASAEPIVVSRSVAPVAFNATIEQLHHQFPFFEEICFGPYRLICFGPFQEPDIIVDAGGTGLEFAENDTAGVVIVDMERKQPYGPYIIANPLDGAGAGDDVRICYWKCLFPNPLYARAQGDFHVGVWVNGNLVFQRDVNADAEFGVTGEYPLPPAFGCPGYQYPCD